MSFNAKVNLEKSQALLKLQIKQQKRGKSHEVIEIRPNLKRPNSNRRM